MTPIWPQLIELLYCRHIIGVKVVVVARHVAEAHVVLVLRRSVPRSFYGTNAMTGVVGCCLK